MKQYTKKRMIRTCKSRFLLTIFVLTILLFSGCARKNSVSDGITDIPNNKNEDVSSDTNVNEPTNNPEDSSSNTLSTGENTNSNGNTHSDNEITTTPENSGNNIPVNSLDVLNNGGMYVGYQGDVYYRQYNEASFEKEGLWGNFYSIADMPKNMMRIRKDGTSEIVFEDHGSGNIYITNDKLFLQTSEVEYNSAIYSVDFTGNNRLDINKGWIAGIDEETDTLICELSTGEYSYALGKIDGSTGTMTTYDLSTPCLKFLSVREGVIFYQGQVDDEASQAGKMRICSVNVDGTDEKILVETMPESNKSDVLYDYSNYGTEIPCFQFVGNTLYYSYGTYAGTGNFYQGGRIAKVNTDGSDHALLLGTSKKDEISYDNYVMDTFYVTTADNQSTLYYYPSVESEQSSALDITTLEEKPTDFLIRVEGKPFEYEGGISIYWNSSPERTTLIPKIDYSYLKLENTADYQCTIEDIEVCGDWVYYKLEASEYAPEVSVGWRDGYRHIKSVVLRQELVGDKVEVMFEYEK